MLFDTAFVSRLKEEIPHDFDLLISFGIGESWICARESRLREKAGNNPIDSRSITFDSLSFLIELFLHD
jgi:hypothetical protein